MRLLRGCEKELYGKMSGVALTVQTAQENLEQDLERYEDLNVWMHHTLHAA